jgi:hypothetical protein
LSECFSPRHFWSVSLLISYHCLPHES